MTTKPEIILTPEQEQKIIDFWNLQPEDPPDLKDVIIHVFGEGHDGRSLEGKAVSKCISEKLGKKPKTADQYIKKTITLTEEQKTFIINNSATMNSLEIARELFKNLGLTNLSAETRAVNAFRKTLDTRVVYNQGQQDNVIPKGDYEPPKTLDPILKRVNKYVNGVLNKDALTTQQKKNLFILINYLHTFRFIKQMNTYDEEDRTLCEDAFIRSTYDKPDLKQEEVDQYIEYANQVVQGFKSLRRKELLESSLEDNTIANRDNPEEQRKSRMDLVEAIGKASVEYNQCIKRQSDLLDDLKQKRSVRLSKEVAESASMLTFVQLWRFEEEREKLLKLAEYEQQNIANEVERLTSVEELKARILGLDKDGILLG